MTRRPLQPESLPRSDQIPKFVYENIDELTRAQAHLEKQMGVEHHLSSRLTSVFGTLPFLIAQSLFIGLWVLWNSGWLHSVQPFDPAPFSFLSSIVTLEAIALTVVILINQNRTREMVDRRDELNLHVSLMIEKETTTILKKLTRLEQKMKIEVDHEESSHTDELLKETKPVELANSIELTTQKAGESESIRASRSPVEILEEESRPNSRGDDDV